MPEFKLVHYMDLNPGEIPKSMQCANLELSLVEAWHIFDSRGDAALVSLSLGNRIIYDQAGLLALMERVSEASRLGTSLERAAEEIAQERTIDEDTFESICDEVRQSLPETIFRNDVTLETKRCEAIAALLRYTRQYLGIRLPGGGVAPTGGSHFDNIYNALANLVDHRASPHFFPESHMEAFMKRVFGETAWVNEPRKS